MSVYHKKLSQEKEFAKKAFKADPNTAKASKTAAPGSLVDQDEVEYLKTIGFMHWMVYPYIKAIRGIMNCRHKPIPFRQEFPDYVEKQKSE